MDVYGAKARAGNFCLYCKMILKCKISILDLGVGVDVLIDTKRVIICVETSENSNAASIPISTCVHISFKE